MIDEFIEHLKSQNKRQNIIDSYIQSVKHYINWLSLKGNDPTVLREQDIDETISYTIFEGSHNISL